jgi:hypothetical protein
MGFRRFFPLFALAAVLAVSARADDAWCGICGDFFEGPPAAHAKAHGNAVWCGDCDGVYEKGHVHLAKRFAEEAKRKKAEEASAASDAASDATPVPGTPSAAEPKSPLADAAARLAPLKRYWWAVPAVLVFWLFLLPVLKTVLFRPKASRAWDFPMENGVPKGVELVPDRLVCSENGKDDGGGTAIGYPAMIRLGRGRRWTPAFVKRMIGKQMRQDVRFPALRFEADVLERLKDTGAVPRLLVPPAQTTLPNGQYWAYYAMSVAPGEPWPPRGGLGGETRRALVALCEALVRLHEREIGHHDLKPQNLFWDGRRVTLIDLGSAIDHRATAPDRLVNPLGGDRVGSRPWVPPVSDGRILSDYSLASDAWVYGLLFCEALVGGVCDANFAARHWHAADPQKGTSDDMDHEWFFQRLSETESPDLAHAVVEGLFSFQASRRISLSKFLKIVRKEWGL